MALRGSRAGVEVGLGVDEEEAVLVKVGLGEGLGVVVANTMGEVVGRRVGDDNFRPAVQAIIKRAMPLITMIR